MKSPWTVRVQKGVGWGIWQPVEVGTVSSQWVETLKLLFLQQFSATWVQAKAKAGIGERSLGVITRVGMQCETGI